VGVISAASFACMSWKVCLNGMDEDNNIIINLQDEEKGAGKIFRLFQTLNSLICEYVKEKA
jgi:hypothetical protein